jgi:hypothetical protein
MTMSKKDLGIALVMLRLLNERRLPYALQLKERVDRGEPLSEYDREFLKEATDEARFIPALLERQPQFKPLANEVFALLEHIAAKGLENEKATAKKN